MTAGGIELVALDLDGTLIGDDLRLSPRTVAAVRAVVARGVHVSIVTGRMTSSALPYARELGLRDPLVGYQGALIREMPAAGSARLGRLLVHRPLAADVARDTLPWCRAGGLAPHANHLERLIVGVDDPKASDYSRYGSGRTTVVADLDAWLVHPVTKIISVGDPPLADRALARARADFAGRAEATVSHPMFLEFLAPGVSKGRALRFLARRLGVDRRRTLAIGDQLNDLEMLAEAGVGVAMAGAPDVVRASARVVAPSLAEDGVARVLEELVLGRAGETAGLQSPGTVDPGRDRHAVVPHGRE